MEAQLKVAPSRIPTPVRAKPIPAEGEDGLFRQSWYPICLSKEVGKGEVIGRTFLDGKVVVVRGEDGVARVMSAYCPHIGADLSLGKVIGNNLQCAFHHWEYDVNGQCAKTGIGDPPPRSACLFIFPSQERFGIVWAFNGEEPLFDLPTLEYDEDEILLEAYTIEPFNCDPWVFAANTPDMQHLKAVHKVQFKVPDPHDLVEWDQYGLRYTFEGVHQKGVELKWTLGLRGTSFFWREGPYDGFWCGAVTGFGIPVPGTHQVYGAFFVKKGPHAAEQLEIMRGVSMRTIGEDRDILNTIHYRQGTFTAADKTLAKYLTIVREFPRAHPSAPFIK